jgi:hypothetical protein
MGPPFGIGFVLVLVQISGINSLLRKRFPEPSDKSDGSILAKPEGFRVFKGVDFSR